MDDPPGSEVPEDGVYEQLTSCAASSHAPPPIAWPASRGLLVNHLNPREVRGPCALRRLTGGVSGAVAPLGLPQPAAGAPPTSPQLGA